MAQHHIDVSIRVRPPADNRASTLKTSKSAANVAQPFGGIGLEVLDSQQPPFIYHIPSRLAALQGQASQLRQNIANSKTAVDRLTKEPFWHEASPAYQAKEREVRELEAQLQLAGE